MHVVADFSGEKEKSRTEAKGISINSMPNFEVLLVDSLMAVVQLLTITISSCAKVNVVVR